MFLSFFLYLSSFFRFEGKVFMEWYFLSLRTSLKFKISETVQNIKTLEGNQEEQTEHVAALTEQLSQMDESIDKDRTEFKKVENKLKKLKIALSGSIESLKDSISVSLEDKTVTLAENIAALREETDAATAELKQRFDGFESCDVVNITRRLSTARTKINEIIEKTSELDLQLKEINRDKSTNLLLHGLPFKVRICWEDSSQFEVILVYAFLSPPPQDCEQLTDLVKEISDVLRTRLGIGREMALVTAHR